VENLIVFTLIGLLIGAAARIFYPGRRPMHILGTMALGTCVTPRPRNSTN